MKYLSPNHSAVGTSRNLGGWLNLREDISLIFGSEKKHRWEKMLGDTWVI